MGSHVYSSREECYQSISSGRLLEGTTCMGDEARGYRTASRAAPQKKLNWDAVGDIALGVLGVAAGLIVLDYAVKLFDGLLNNRHCHEPSGGGERIWHEHPSGQSHAYLGRRCTLFDDDEE